MASGFQQDLNQLQPNFYRVAIDMSNAAFYPTADGTTNGGVTPSAWDSFATPPTTMIKSKARARGNMRFRNVINSLTGIADCQILDVTITEANGDAQATALAFTVKYERDAFIPITGTLLGNVAVGNNVANAAMTTTAQAIANAIAIGVSGTSTGGSRCYDPVAAIDTQTKITVTAATTPANILSTITVSLIDTTTVINA